MHQLNQVAAGFSEFVLFSGEAVHALDARAVTFEKQDKQAPYVFCPVRNEEVQPTPEEHIRPTTNDLQVCISSLEERKPFKANL